MKEQPRMIYRSMQGKEVDMNKLMNQNEMTVAVGNARINARGDELGPGGKIIRKREDVVKMKQPIPAQSHVRRSFNPEATTVNTLSETTNIVSEATTNVQNNIIRKKSQTQVQTQIQPQSTEGTE